MKYLLLVAICGIGWWMADLFLPLPFGGMALTLGTPAAVLWFFIMFLRRGVDKKSNDPSWIDDLERKAGVPQESTER